MSKNTTMEYFFKEMDSPVGRLKIVGSDNGLAAILWENDNPNRIRVRTYVENNTHPVLLETEHQLNEYFQGKRTSFSLTLDPVGTEFQQQVWSILSTIPFGQTRSYLDIAKQMGNIKAVRAVGAANGRNPISIVVPCHRVIGSSGELTGFAGGLEAKATLLSMEGVKTAKTQIELPWGD
jgi:methylated-DNA-[protein]-cysteine S-methyltransferase